MTRHGTRRAPGGRIVGSVLALVVGVAAVPAVSLLLVR